MDTRILAFLLLAILRAMFGDEAEATIVGPNIISKADWRAKAPKETPELLATNPPPFVIIHHSATAGCIFEDECKIRVRSIQNHHMNTNGWNDIGYNFLVGEDGNVYEGRGWGVRGAHSPNYNTKSIGICIIGSFDYRNPNPEAIYTTNLLIKYGVSMGLIKEDYALFGHRQTRSTTCPGDSLYRLIGTWPHYVWGNYYLGYPME